MHYSQRLANKYKNKHKLFQIKCEKQPWQEKNMNLAHVFSICIFSIISIYNIS